MKTELLFCEITLLFYGYKKDAREMAEQIVAKAYKLV
jgi:hypothetical protein